MKGALASSVAVERVSGSSVARVLPWLVMAGPVCAAASLAVPVGWSCRLESGVVASSVVSGTGWSAGASGGEVPSTPLTMSSPASVAPLRLTWTSPSVNCTQRASPLVTVEGAEELEELGLRIAKSSWVSRAAAPSAASGLVGVGLTRAGSAVDAVVGPLAVAMSWASAATSALRATI